MIADNKITGIEQIDIKGSGANTLVLSRLEVLNISDESNTLIVPGDGDDTLIIDCGWTRNANETIGGVQFAVLTQGAATLKIASVVKGLSAPLKSSFRAAHLPTRRTIPPP